MDYIYGLLDVILPVDWLQFDFMKNAFLAVLLITPLFGLLSTMVVSNRMAFFSDSLGHGAFTGLAIGAIVGFFSPVESLVLFSVFFALVITLIKNYTSASTDTVIGVFSSTGIAIGLMIMSYGGGFNKFSGYLIGDILSITPDDIAALLIVLVSVVVVWGLMFNKLLILSLNSPFAKSRGGNVIITESIFAVMVAVVVAISIQWVGLLIINSLLVLPAAAARNISNSVKQYHLFSVGSAMLAGISGLILAYRYNMAAGATIVVIAALIFFVTMILKSRFVR
ncbi:MAG: metal ABC transporter permease [Anaerovibrio sp.]|uniref:metal ABC transporter permease n=1 Tax=Anaerovibrio sp. TaxID=1872532 RepID=UPI0025DEC6DC|nr:metal ABC transporter permease [Anaerovibrio sp.]MCR5176582.1 metal ABC transporter permease [Anaerovibrio sp.]